MYARFNAIIEFDLKKIIAFSTLSQLGLIITILFTSINNFVFFHLISHAIFKSLLFLCAGIIIHAINNIQDIRFIRNLVNEIPLTIIYFNIANLSLCGFPFLSGFYSKDILYEIILNYNINLFIFTIIYLCLLITLIYSLRLIYYLSLNKIIHSTINIKSDSLIINLSTFLLIIISIIFRCSIN